MSDLTSPDAAREKTAVARTAVLMFCLTLLGKILGFGRELTFASFLGTSSVSDAYLMAQTIPNVLLNGVIAALGTTYMPVFSHVVERHGKDEGSRFTSRLLVFVQLLSLAVILLGLLFSRQLVSLFAARFAVDTAALTLRFLKVLLFVPLFSCGVYILEAYLQYHSRFLSPILAGYSVDLCVIAAVCASSRFGYMLLPFGSLVGYLLCLAVLLAAALRQGFRFRPLPLVFTDDIRQIVILAVPVFLGASFAQINASVDRFLAAGLPVGTISALNYGYLLLMLINSLTSTLITTLVYPRMSQAAAASDWDGLNGITQTAVSLTMLITIPLCLGALCFSSQLVQVVYERGAFGAASTEQTAEAFFCYSLGLVFSALNAVLTLVFYSSRETKKPVSCNAAGIVLNIMLNLLLVRSLQHKGIALATSVASVFTFFLLWRALRRVHPSARVLPSRAKALQITLAAALSVALALAVYRFASLVWMPRMVYLTLAVLAAAAAYLPLLRWMRVEEMELLLDLTSRKLS